MCVVLCDDDVYCVLIVCFVKVYLLCECLVILICWCDWVYDLW